MKNTVELLGYYGGDVTHCQSAWTSTNRDLTPAKLKRMPSLLKQLKEGNHGEPHGSVFEKSALHFLVVTDIATHIHLLKHRIGVSINGESARYKELKDDKSYIPYDWPPEWKERLAHHTEQSFKLYHECYESLVNDYGCDKKRAKESARFFNPYASQLTADVQFNFRSFIHFCRLRAVDGAQKEIRNIARDMILQVMNIEGNPFEHSIRVWELDKLVEEPE